MSELVRGICVTVNRQAWDVVERLFAARCLLGHVPRDVDGRRDE